MVQNQSATFSGPKENGRGTFYRCFYSLKPSFEFPTHESTELEQLTLFFSITASFSAYLSNLNT